MLSTHPLAAARQRVAEIDSAELRRRVAAGARLIDVREPHEFSQGHLHGAINLPLSRLPLLLADASRAGQLPAVDARLRAQLARETFIHDLFAAHGAAARLRVVASAHAVPWSQRARCALYALCPALLAPLFAAKRIASAVRAGSR